MAACHRTALLFAAFCGVPCACAGGRHTGELSSAEGGGRGLRPSSGGQPGRDASASGATSFPLVVSPNKRYLVDRDGLPFLMIGDTAWSLIAELSQADAIFYLNDRESRGFNTLLVNLIEHKFTSHIPRWANAQGVEPFRNRNDFTTANAAYFDHTEWVVAQALERDMLVLLAPAYLGWDCAGKDEGWCRELLANGLVNVREYGRYLGHRFHDYPNIVWVNGGDHTPSTDGHPSELDFVEALVAGLRETDRNDRLHTAHWRSESSTDGPVRSWLELDATYSYLGQRVVEDCRRDWVRDADVRPLFFLEGLYEGEHDSTGAQLRAQMYQPMLSGAMGFLFGNGPIWYFGRQSDDNPGWDFASASAITWQKALAGRGTHLAMRAAEFFRSIAWHQLRPDSSGSILIDVAGGSNAEANVSLASAPDGALAVAYFTARITATIDLRKLTGPLRASWFDPASGGWSVATGSPLAGAGRETFTPPRENANAEADWILVLAK